MNFTSETKEVDLPDSDSLDTEDEIQLIRKSANQESAQPVLKPATWSTARTGPELSNARAKSLPKETEEDASHGTANVWQAHTANDYEEEIRIRQVGEILFEYLSLFDEYPLKKIVYRIIYFMSDVRIYLQQ